MQLHLIYAKNKGKYNNDKAFSINWDRYETMLVYFMKNKF